MTHDGVMLEYGSIKPPRICKTVPAKLKYIYDEVYKLILEYGITEIACEDQFLGSRKSTLKTLSQLRGVIMLASEQHCVPMHYYWPSTVKAAVCKGNATKAEVIEAVKSKFGVEVNDNIADAIAVLVAHQLASSSAPRVGHAEEKK